MDAELQLWFGSLLSVIKNNVNTYNLQKRPSVRRKDDKCQSLMEEEVQRSLGLIKLCSSASSSW